MMRIEKAFLGAMGGLCAVLVKFLGQDYSNLVAHAANLTADQLLAYKVGYGVLTPILMFLGAFVAWISDEQKRVKIVMLAIAAPAMITTWSGGHKSESPSVGFLMSSAYAQPLDFFKQFEKVENPDEVSNTSTWEKIQDGIGTFFGYGKQPQKYWVVVGSFQDRQAAQQYADQINAENKSLNAWVGQRVASSDYYPVMVGDYSLLGEAREWKQKALATPSIKEAFLSTAAKK